MIPENPKLSHQLIPLDGAFIHSLVNANRTPLFIYDRQVIKRKCSLFNQLEQFGVNTLYSLKANPNIHICNFIKELGLQAEIASVGELKILENCGFDISRCGVAGPAKTDRDLRLYITVGVGYVNCESLTEAYRIAAIGAELNIVPKINLRINPGENLFGARIKMGGKATPFGVDEEMLRQVVREIENIKHIQLVGIHVYCGTQLLDIATIVANFEYTSKLAEQVMTLTNRTLDVIDFGGGFGIPLSAADEPLDEKELFNKLSLFFSTLRNKSLFSNTIFLIESGRFIVGDAGYFVCKVVDVKVSREKKFVILDGGINHYMSLSPFFRFEAHNPRIRLIKKHYAAGMPVETVELAGPLCTSLDCLARKVVLPAIDIDDLVVFPNAGAYALTMSPVNFLGHDYPLEILV